MFVDLPQPECLEVEAEAVVSCDYSSFVVLLEYIYSVLRSGCCLDLNFGDEEEKKRL